jgi:2-phosphoglycerate kinase
VKTYVVDKQKKARAPFLRGILIRTLLEAGMPFERAYEFATQIRDGLSDTEEITSEHLRQKVSKLLLDAGESDVQKQYLLPLAVPARILVISRGGSESAFSRSKHQRYLQSSGVRLADAEQITTIIFDQLLASGAKRVSTIQLSYLTYLCLAQEFGKTAARQYLVWMEFQHSGRPLILLIGGAVGTGKSSLATEIAHRLEIVRTQSTDMLREVMRTMIPKKLLPILHCSSFDAWKTLPVQVRKQRDKDMLIAEGYRSQVDLLALPCEAVMKRAIKESVPLILEGVHSHPDLLHRLSGEHDALLVHVTLAVMNQQDLQARLRGRGMEVPQRRSRRYLKKFDSIWRLQSFLVSEAERCDTPVIPNDDKEAAIYQVISTVNSELSHHFSGDPEDVFGNLFSSLSRKLKGKSWQKALPQVIGADIVEPAVKPSS